MEKLLLIMLSLSSTSIIIITCVLWYILGLVFILLTKYLSDGIVSLLDIILSALVAPLGVFIIIVYLMIKHEWFDDIIIFKGKKFKLFWTHITKQLKW